MLSDPSTLNRYTYVNGNPINLVDPDGHAPRSSSSDPDEDPRHHDPDDYPAPRPTPKLAPQVQHPAGSWQDRGRNAWNALVGGLSQVGHDAWNYCTGSFGGAGTCLAAAGALLDATGIGAPVGTVLLGLSVGLTVADAIQKQDPMELAYLAAGLGAGKLIGIVAKPLLEASGELLAGALRPATRAFQKYAGRIAAADGDSSIAAQASILDGPAVAARLQGHVDRAASIVDDPMTDALTPGQRLATSRNPSLYPMFRGNRIDVLAKTFANADVQLAVNDVAISWGKGPDFLRAGTNEWWDITTPGQWAQHLERYNNFGFLLGT
jgi:hypothetical protein